MATLEITVQKNRFSKVISERISYKAMAGWSGELCGPWASSKMVSIDMTVQKLFRNNANNTKIRRHIK